MLIYKEKLCREYGYIIIKESNLKNLLKNLKQSSQRSLGETAIFLHCNKVAETDTGNLNCMSISLHDFIK